MRIKALLAYQSYGKPWKSMIYIGITGTDGKSTTSYLSYHILKSANYKVGLISTVFVDIGDGLQDNETKMTSLDHKVFWKYIKKAEAKGLTHMVIEVSSHALYQSRIRPTKFKAVGFTNLSREHLDFHWTMEHYAQSKSQLFAEVVSGSLWIVGTHFKHRDILDLVNRVTKLETFGYDDASNIFVSDIQQNPLLSFYLHYQEKIFPVTTKILWSFNAENMMIATVLTRHVWVALEKIVSALSSFPGLPGRQEMLTTKQWVSVMIDFALTPDALQTLYTAVRSMRYARLIAVFGATGTRDQGKRPEMWRIATKFCDSVVITEDENYSEDGLKIMEQIYAGVEETSRSKVSKIQDRTEAIRYAISIAQPWDIIIVTGMANFATRAMNDWYIDRNERAVIMEALKSASYEIID
jgi:UDP-N-acetylmuramoyl-L-alanyl-D-glutamate--2,6-diaminopimelate ligase